METHETVSNANNTVTCANCGRDADICKKFEGLECWAARAMMLDRKIFMLERQCEQNRDRGREIDRKSLIEGCSALIALMKDPQPLLATWNDACTQAVEKIRGSLDAPPTRPPAFVLGHRDDGSPLVLPMRLDDNGDLVQAQNADENFNGIGVFLGAPGIKTFDGTPPGDAEYALDTLLPFAQSPAEEDLTLRQVVDRVVSLLNGAQPSLSREVEVFWDGDGFYFRLKGDNSHWFGPHEKIHDACSSAIVMGFTITDVRTTRGAGKRPSTPPSGTAQVLATGSAGAHMATLPNGDVVGGGGEGRPLHATDAARDAGGIGQ